MAEAGSRLLAPASERPTHLLAWSVAVALPALGLLLLGHSRGRCALGAPPFPLLAGAGRGAGQRRARLSDQRRRAALRAVPGLRATSLGEVEVKGKREPVDAYLIDAQFG